MSCLKWFSALLALLLAPAFAQAQLTLFAPNTIPAPIYVERTAPQEELAAAADMARILGIMSGQTFSVRWASPRQTERGIYLLTGASERMRMRPSDAFLSPTFEHGILRVGLRDIIQKDLAAQGDSLARIKQLETYRAICEEDRLYLVGEDSEGLALTVYWFLQKYGGVRWFAPGDLGEHIPRRASWSIPALKDTAQPAYLSRELWAHADPAFDRWARRNLLREHITFSHNMWSLFTREDFEAHPDWLPAKNGRTYPIESYRDNLWHPDLTNPATATHAASRVTTYFDKHPTALSYSIGLNDTIFYGDSATTHPLTTPRQWFRGRPDFSPLVFDWSNQVATQVAQKHPGKLIGTLAYYWNENTPGFPIAENLVPYVTADRSQYYDAAFRAEDTQLLTDWGKSGARLTGIYDYIYGSTYLVPRITHEYLAEAIHTAHTAGHRAYFAELVPQWPYDTGKAWMAARMLFGSALYKDATTAPIPSLEALHKEFLTAYYGPAAAPMERFFAECEFLWKSQPGSARWIKYYQDPYVISLFPPASLQPLADALTAAESALMTAGGDQHFREIQAVRVASTRRAFMALQAASRYYHQLWALERSWPQRMAAGDAVYLELLDLAKQRAALPMLFSTDEYPSGFRKPDVSLFRDDPLLRLFSGFVRDLHKIRGASGQFFNLIEDDFFRTTRSTFGPSLVDRKLRQALGDRILPPENLLRNSGFEDAASESPVAIHALLPNHPLTHWWSDARECEHFTASLTPAAAHSGNLGLRVSGADNFRTGQFVKVTPDTLLSFSAYVRGFSAPGSRVGLRISWFDSHGTLLSERKGDRLPPGQCDDWVLLNAIDLAPTGAAWARCTFDIVGQPPESTVDMDDAFVSLLAAE